MNKHTLRVLEYDKVISIVAKYAASEVGKITVRSLLPANDIEHVKTRLQETEEFTLILQSGESPPLDGIFDITSVVHKLKVAGTILSPGELLNTALTLGAGRRIKHFFQHFEGKGTLVRSAILLCAKAASIRPLKHLENAVIFAIDEKAEVKDSASQNLRKIRKQITRTREDILSRMSGILQNSGFQKVIQEPVITIRDDRYVLPLKPNFRQSLKGVVHGQSGSRSTLFVEPLEVLEQNNHLAELRMDERDEIERILRELTSLLAQEVSAIAATITTLAEIDAICARARFGIEFNGIVPTISVAGGIRLRTAVHPLLVEKHKGTGLEKSVTPNDIILNEHDRALILSGPNAGGKTVILKTVGLLILMAQSGLPVTAEEGSELPCFKSIFADIGDEQSLEHDLSTFSSHVSNIAEILRLAEKGSLVLLDELGSGTDPAEGAALGSAVLDGLIERGGVTLATTHHNALKLFGSQTNGAINAAMEFDLQTLKPTYRLITGRPGRSYGLDMATRHGVPDGVIQKARTRLSTDESRLDDLLKQVENEARILISNRKSLDKELLQIKQERHEASSLLKAAQEEAHIIKSKAKQETHNVVAALRQQLRELSHAATAERIDIRKKLSEVETLAKMLNPPAPVREMDSTSASTYCAGDRVRILRMNKIGTVLSLQRGSLEIEVGDKKVKLSVNEVAPIDGAPPMKNSYSTPGWGAELHETQGAIDRLNILGFHVEEGLAEVDRFIDRARVDGIFIVTVIHGLGTGALKKAVMEFMRHHPQISSVRVGEPSEGGAGVTVAELKK
ncbi:MAG TPA: endonuclease MutS2 [Nitrospirota bacterium]|nr:endonuclease MutS2 [Nitrospirota bacterium]